MPIDGLIKYSFETVFDVRIFYVLVEKSKRPIFINTKKNGKQFFIRRSASTHALDVEEAISYAIDKWHA